MSNNPVDGGAGDDFLEQILGFPVYAGADSNLAGNEVPMMLQLNSGDRSGNLGGGDGGGGGFEFPLGLSLEQGKGSGEYFKMDHEEASGSGKRFRSDDVVDSRGSPNIRTVRVGDYRFFWCNLVLNLLYRFVLEREKLID